MKLKEGQRDPAVVGNVYEDHERGLTHWVALKGPPPGGWGQSFGGLALKPEHLAVWKAEIASLFGVADIEQIVGRHCFVLRSWPGWGDIEGLEVDGRRFTITGFRQKLWPEKSWDPLKEKAESLMRSIQSNAQRIDDLTTQLGRVRDGYVDWAALSEGEGRE